MIVFDSLCDHGQISRQHRNATLNVLQNANKKKHGVHSQEFRLICLAFACGGMEGTSSDTEGGLFCSEEEGEHNVENFMLSSPCASCVDIHTQRRAV